MTKGASVLFLKRTKIQQGVAEPSTKPAAGPGQRAHERRRLVEPVTATEVDGSGHPGQSWRCVAADISTGGIGLRSRRAVHLGQGVIVRREGSQRALYGVVRQARFVKGEGYCIGLQFEPMPRTPKVGAWLHQQRLTGA